jgi:hypothetical protein
MIKSKTLSNTQYLTQEAQNEASAVARRRRVGPRPRDTFGNAVQTAFSKISKFYLFIYLLKFNMFCMF